MASQTMAEPVMNSPAKGKEVADDETLSPSSSTTILNPLHFLPSNMKKECKKAARILENFCKSGVSMDAHNSKALAKIPREVLNNAIGIVVFSTARIGMHISGTTGSGIIIARLPDGSWSPPSGISVHGVSAGIGAGLVVCHCVCIINTKEGIAHFTEKRASLGSSVAIAAGPFGAVGESAKGGSSEAAQLNGNASGPVKPVLSYVKSSGLFVGVSIDGTVISERSSANASFYGKKVTVDQVLKGDVPHPQGTEVLLDVLRSAEKQI